MTKIAQGKEAVLAYLEEAAQRGSGGKDGEYVLVRDDGGNLYAVIAGHSFIGTGTVTVGGTRLTFTNGLLVPNPS